MIGILHGYELEGSGSNLWTREMVRALCRLGRTVHVVCQEPEPELYDFVAEAWDHREGGSDRLFSREVDYPGRCLVHRPELGDVIPVYVVNTLDVTPKRIRAVELSDDEIEDYLERNVRATARVVEEYGVTALHANHAVLVSEVARRVRERLGTSYAVMPHGSAIEYVVKKDERFRRMAAGAFAAADEIFVIADEIRQRVLDVFGGEVPGLSDKLVRLDVGVDTTNFEPAAHAERAGLVERLERELADEPRGKRPEATLGMYDALAEAGGDGAAQESALATATESYRENRPDADLEAKLDAVDWETAEILLFLGRLVWGKGAQGILAALPDVLEERPETKLLLVGEGPIRELLEAFAAALASGERERVLGFARWDRSLPGTEAPDFSEVTAFLDGLEARGELDAYLERAARHLSPPPPHPESPVVFTGYLRHSLLKYLLPCSDLVLLTSTVREAAPLVFLEALSSGVLPVASYFGGLASSVDAVSEDLPPEVVDVMKLSPETDERVADLARQIPRALEVGAEHAGTLRRLAVERYDWKSVAEKLAERLERGA